MFFLYSFLLAIGSILALPYFLFIARRDGKYLENFRQRLGILPDFDSENSPVIWLHCVSVGETNAAIPLVEELKKQFSNYKLVVSTTTLTGQKLAGEVFKNEASLVFYFPFDFGFAVRRALKKIQPKAVLIMETEIWFNFLRECRKKKIKTVIVNGRLSEKSFRNYHLIRFFVSKGLKNLDLALMQTEADAKRFEKLGLDSLKITITGNIKFDQNFDETETELTRNFRARFVIEKTRPLIVFASTHAPEEEILLDVFSRLGEKIAKNKPRVLIAPRHPERFEEVAEIIEKKGFTFVRRAAEASEKDKISEVILLDSIGELRAVFPLAEIVFVGGSLIPHGGQNILEPAISKTAIVTGFNTFNFSEIVKEFVKKDAVIQLPDLPQDEVARQITEIFSELLGDENRRLKLSQNAFEVMTANRGATAKTIGKLKDIL